MRIYMGGTTRPKLRKARQLAPSHVFGVTWTPSDRRLNQIPFFVDNGAFTSSFDPDEWTSLLDKLEDYSYGPDFVVLPDEYNDAEGTMERHRKWAPEVLDRGLPPAAVIEQVSSIGNWPKKWPLAWLNDAKGNTGHMRKLPMSEKTESQKEQEKRTVVVDGELLDSVVWVERELRDARRALWDGKCGKAFSAIEAAQDEYDKVEAAILDE